MANYYGDQPLVAPYIVNSEVAIGTATALDAIPDTANNYVFASAFSMVYGGLSLSWRPTVPYIIDAPLLAALNAAGAPITQV